MEYQFSRNSYDTPEAHFSMNHEAIGNWLMTEIGTHPSKTKQLIGICESLIARKCWSHEVDGHEFNLRLTRDEAEVTATLLATNMDCDEMEDMNYYDNESVSRCGLDDFHLMLQSWHEYLVS